MQVIEVLKKMELEELLKKIYYVFEDLANATDIKIHKYPCNFIHLAGNTATTRWHGPYTYDEAVRIAKQLAQSHGNDWRFAHWCN